MYCQEISKISFEGLSKTNEGYIRSIIQQKEGGIFKDEIAIADKQLLLNVPLFQEVKFTKSIEDEQVVLHYAFKEKKSVIPLLNFGGLNKESQFWAEAGFIDFNAFGSHALFKFVLAYYGEPSFEVYLDRPRWFNRSWGLSVYANQKNSTEPIYLPDGSQQDFDVSKLKFDLAANYYAGNFLRFDAGVAFLKEDFIALDQDFQSDVLPVILREQKIMFKVRSQWNRMEYNFEFQEGWKVDVFGEVLFPLRNSVGTSFYKSELDLRRFFQLSHTSYVAIRGKFGISTNNSSPIAAFVKDDYTNIRGVGDRVDRGWSELTANIEWRQRLLYRKDFFIQGTIFTDLNGLSVPGDSLESFLNADRFDIYGGFGFRLGLNEYYNSTIRFDFSFDLEERKWAAIVVGVGQFF
jgi:outer membrane protein assembly factor BamA